MIPNDIIRAIREHALVNYDQGGWDYLVECWSDEDIAQAMGGATDLRLAISKCAETLELMDEHRREIQSTEW